MLATSFIELVAFSRNAVFLGAGTGERALINLFLCPSPFWTFEGLLLLGECFSFVGTNPSLIMKINLGVQYLWGFISLLAVSAAL